ncbi:esterase family protein [Polaribacter haliotis]|uniref:Esterase family protein n=1 Tax=Polaribacter haliotis TaxID=1888915 RepID=A0A7L8AIK2_9FLAO|nr:alpha/beta hydrolase family protein [Polaribacter haliotis]QOD61813.1 esterase family protein [Polaribacter haliotis]
MKVAFTFLFLLVNIFTAKAEIDTLTVKSKVMNKEISNLIILPKGYQKQNAKLPVLYMLHGAGGYFSIWVKRFPNLQKYANEHHMIIVCPDAITSWYFDSPIDKNVQYETYVTKELVNYIDANYNTIKDRKGRAVLGLSMGGHGAFYLSFRNQDVFGAAGSMSGGLDIRPFPKNWDLSKRLGDYATNKEVWENNTVINMIHLLKGSHLKLIFDCGTSDFFYDANKRMHKKLLERNIPHDYIERPGGHSPNYWRNSLKYQILFMSDFFKG